jgi:hypothetical protein
MGRYRLPTTSRSIEDRVLDSNQPRTPIQLTSERVSSALRLKTPQHPSARDGAEHTPFPEKRPHARRDETRGEHGEKAIVEGKIATRATRGRTERRPMLKDHKLHATMLHDANRYVSKVNSHTNMSTYFEFRTKLTYLWKN